MADTPETKAKKKLKKLLPQWAYECGAHVTQRSNAAGGVGFSTGIADWTIQWWPDRTYCSVAVDVEVKAKQNGPSPKQIVELTNTFKGGGHGIVVWPDDPVDLEHFHRFLQSLTVRTPPTLKLERHMG